MSDIDAFLDGRGRLATLLRALPAFEPPAHMEARFLATLPDTALPDVDGHFAPPASLEAAIVAEAARLDAAQAPRRQAVLDDIAREGADAALGARLTPGTQRWLTGQQPPPAARPRAPRRRFWLAPLGGALAATLALGVALQLMRERPQVADDAAFAPPARPAAMQEGAAPPAAAEAKVLPEPRLEHRAGVTAGAQAPDEPVAAAPAVPKAIRPQRRQDATAHKPTPLADAAQSAPAGRSAAVARSALRPKAEVLGSLSAAPATSRPAAEHRAPPAPTPRAEPAPAASALAPAPAPATTASRRFAPNDINGMAHWIADAPGAPDTWQLSGAMADQAAIARVIDGLRAHPLLRERGLRIRTELSHAPGRMLTLTPIQTPD